jgi:hypothetical protein
LRSERGVHHLSCKNRRCLSGNPNDRVHWRTFGAADTSAVSINDSGQIVGTFLECNTGSFDKGFPYSKGTYTILDFSGAIVTHPLSISAKGEVVGYYEVGSNGSITAQHGFLYNFSPSFLSVDVGYGAGSERSRVGLARADADGLIDPEHEDFSIANLAGFCGCCNGLDDFVDLSCSRGHLNLELR